MQKLYLYFIALFLGTFFLIPSSANAGQESAKSSVSESRILVRAKTENLRQSNPGPLREPLIKFVEGLADDVAIRIYGRGVHAAKSTEESDSKVIIILNAANANQLLDISLVLGPDAEKDPHFLVKVQLAGVERQANHQPNRPAYTVSGILWEQKFRLDTDASLKEATATFAEAISIAVTQRLVK